MGDNARRRSTLIDHGNTRQDHPASESRIRCAQLSALGEEELALELEQFQRVLLDAGLAAQSTDHPDTSLNSAALELQRYVEESTGFLVQLDVRADGVIKLLPRVPDDLMQDSWETVRWQGLLFWRHRRGA